MSDKPMKVLLVDDDEDDFFMIKELLSERKGASIKIEWAQSFDSAFELMALRQHDAYLVDYRLGEKSGLDLLQEVQAKEQHTAPIIVLTGYGDHEVDVKAMKTGAADYLVKDQLSAQVLERSIRYSVNRARSMAELREREESVRNLFNAAFEGIIVHDADGRILDINWTGAKILDHVPRSIIGTNQLDYFDKDIVDVLIKSAESGSPHTFKTLCHRKDGSKVHLEVSAKTYHYRGKPVFLTSCRDVSERVQMEAQILQQDRLASVGLLASSLAHEIGTPLGIIRGRAEFLDRQTKDNPAVGQCAHIIISQIDRVSVLIRSLLTLARGQGSGPVAAVDTQRVVTEVLDLLGHEFVRKGIECQNSLKAGAFVMAEPGPLHQVLLNLLVNSIHAIETAVLRGRASGHLVSIYAEDAGAQWRLCVEDTGCGISEVDKKQLFKPFFTTKDIGVGTGLGLATSFRIMEGWGGGIQVQSQEGLGTVFKLLLPKAPVRE